MTYPPVVIVDKDNNPIGTAMLRDAWARSLYYRVVAVLIEDMSGRILLQKRALGAEVDPGKWDMSAGGHVDEGQTYETAAAVELKEEIGLQHIPLRDLGVRLFDYDKVTYFLKFFAAVVPEGTALNPGQSEVSDVRWFSREEFGALLRDHPEQCANFLKRICARYPDALPAGSPSAT